MFYLSDHKTALTRLLSLSTYVETTKFRRKVVSSEKQKDLQSARDLCRGRRRSVAVLSLSLVVQSFTFPMKTLSLSSCTATATLPLLAN